MASFEVGELSSGAPLPLTDCRRLSGGGRKITDFQQLTNAEDLLVLFPQYSFISFSSVFLSVLLLVEVTIATQWP